MRACGIPRGDGYGGDCEKGLRKWCLIFYDNEDRYVSVTVVDVNVVVVALVGDVLLLIMIKNRVRQCLPVAGLQCHYHCNINNNKL